ncbi:MAG: carboxypeptidase regulatory-like domain-containing protein [Chitinispirillaceae bacterium]|nr:carboxypeptidase regulatory-like domain-containing protein [Chitinispirillaceae bacterium]
MDFTPLSLWRRQFHWHILCFLTVAVLCFIQCNKSSTSPPEPTRIVGVVSDISDSSAIRNANIVVYDANTNAPVSRVFSDSLGVFFIIVEPGTYYIRCAAQGYFANPLPSGKPISFQIDEHKTVDRQIFLARDAVAANTGRISGTIMSTPGSQPVPAALIIALRSSDSLTIGGTSGPDGFFILFNVPQGTYDLQFLKGGFQQDSVPYRIVVASGDSLSGLAITMSSSSSRSLRGKITFLAAKNDIVDITLIHPVSREAIPGLYTFNNANLDYEINAVPAGTYIVWASYRNDGYVVDPDWIRKNGMPTVEFPRMDTIISMNFSVTDTIGIRFPTNPADSVYPVTVTTVTPVFKWSKYPQAKEMIIEVTDIHGTTIWGGYDTAGMILHAQIDALSLDSVPFNFDGSASEALQQGEVYRWKIYADDSADPDIQGLISSSEDLRGLFIIDTTGRY